MNWQRSFGVLPGIGVSLIPKLICPLCWPAYAGLISAAGLGFLIDARNLLMVTALFLIAAVAALSFRARRRRGYGPAIAGLVAGIAIVASKFYLESAAIIYVALGLLIGASIWNGWPVQPSSSCPRCAFPDEFLKEKGL
jgi:hypothetical protein